MSLSEISINQTKDLFIIGKNFLKGTRVVFQKLGLDEKTVEWQSEAEIEAEYFQQVSTILPAGQCNACTGRGLLNSSTSVHIEICTSKHER